MNRLSVTDCLPSYVQSALVVSLVLMGCSDAIQPPTPASFSRPGDVAFVCFEDETPRPLLACGGSPEGKFDSESPPTYALHALVTQTETGALATVDLGRGAVYDKEKMAWKTADLGVGAVLDNRPDVPGFTFVDVGDLPTTVVVPEQNPEFTYVGTATGQIGGFDTWSLNPSVGKAFVQRIQDPPLQLPGAAVAASLAVAPDGNALFVASPTTGELFVVPICRDDAACELGTLLDPMVFDLSESQSMVGAVVRGPEGEPYSSRGFCLDSERFGLEPEPVWPGSGQTAGDAGAGDAGFGDGGMADAGGSDTGVPDAGSSDAGSRDAGTMDASNVTVGAADSGAAGVSARARPVDLAIDVACDGVKGCKPRLLVADEALPWIHVFEIDGADLTPIAPMMTGAPTVAVAVTPDVPSEVRGDALTHYVYAIDREEGSVLVLQDGALLPVNGATNKRVDRLSFGDTSPGTRALSLTVVTPAYQGDEALTCEKLGSSTELRGVFLIVALSNGQILTYDIYDRDLQEHSAPPESDNPPKDAKLDDGTCRECPYVLRRHQRRMSALKVDSSLTDVGAGVGVTEGPIFSMGTRTFSVDEYGMTTTTALPELACVECPEGMAGSFAVGVADAGGTNSSGTEGDEGSSFCEPGQARICGRADPFLATGQKWVLSYQGALRGSRGLGSLAAGSTEFVLSERTGLRFCEAGVQGEDTLGASGDVLVLVNHDIEDAVANSWPADRSIRARCETLRQALQNRELAVVIPIEAAYDRRLVLGARNIVSRVTDSKLRGGLPVSLDEVTLCLHGGDGGGDVQAGPLMNFEVRTRDSFVVSGELGAAHHRITADSAGRCVVDESLDVSRSFRATVASNSEPGNAAFSNGAIAFALRSSTQLANDEPPKLNFTMGTLTPSVGFNATGGGVGVLPQTIRYGSSDERLYVVDPHLLGLFSIPLSDFATGSSNVDSYK